MLSLLKIKNIALIDDLSLEFGKGLNLLTGETGSGKSIIVDSLGVLTGTRASSDLVKEGEEKALVEGLFFIDPDERLRAEFDESGVEIDEGNEAEIIVRRELSSTGRNRIFVNNQLVTQGFLKKIGIYLADIHGQGEQATLFNPANHIEILDEYGELEDSRAACAEKFREWRRIKSELRNLSEDESEKLQLIDILKFQVDEIGNARLETGEDEKLEEEKKRLNNSEKLADLSGESYSLLYDDDGAVTANLEKVTRKIAELTEFDSGFEQYKEGLDSARAVLEDLAYALRDYKNSIEFSPERLEVIENRLAEISRLKRKYGGSLETVLAHFKESNSRLESIETSELREKELRKHLEKAREAYLSKAEKLHQKRVKAAKKFEKEVEENLTSVALEKAKFVVNFEKPEDITQEASERFFTTKGFETIEFYFSANPGESPKPLAKVASGGEASRVMLILKTSAKTDLNGKTAVFDEVDAGIGGRVAEAVGRKLQELSSIQQVLCVTHQPQVASLADQHFIVEKDINGKKTKVGVRTLGEDERVEEIARMLAGENITETAREHAIELLGGKKRMRKGTHS